MEHLPERRATLSAGLKLSALLAYPLLMWRSARAQEIPIETDPAPGPDSASIEALRAEIADLRKTVERLDAESSTIKAPFTVYDGNTQKTLLNVSLNSSGRPRLSMKDSSGAEVWLGFSESGGAMVISDGGGTTRAQIVGTSTNSQVVLTDSTSHVVLGSSADGQQTGFFLERDGKRAAELIAGAAGGELLMMDGAGKALAKLSGDGSKPLSLFSQAGETAFSVEINDGHAAMALGDPKAALLRAGITTNGGGSFLVLSDQKGSERALFSTAAEEKLLSLRDTASTEYFSVTQIDNRPLMALGDPAKAHLLAGATPNGNGSFLSLLDSASQERVIVTAEAKVAPLALLDEQSEQVFSVSYDGDWPTLKLGKESAAHLQTGVMKDGSGSYLSLYDTGNTERAFINAMEGATRMQLNDKEMTADLGSDEISGKAGLFMSKGELNFASIRFSKDTGGEIRIADEKGVGGVYASCDSKENGGTIDVAAAGGAKHVAILSGRRGGGNLSLYDKDSNEPRVQLSGDKTGDLNLYSPGGTFTARSGKSGGPIMQLANADGTVVLEAYVSADGVGAVKCGPAGNGLAGTIGGGAEAASAIAGKK